MCRIFVALASRWWSIEAPHAPSNATDKCEPFSRSLFTTLARHPVLPQGHNTMPSMGPFQVALIRLVTTGDAPSLIVTDCHFNDTDGIEAAVFAIDGAVNVSLLGFGGWVGGESHLRRVLAAVTPVVVLLPLSFPPPLSIFVSLRLFCHLQWDVAIDDCVFAHNAVAPVHAFNADFNLSITNSYFLDNRDKYGCEGCARDCVRAGCWRFSHRCD